MTIATIMILCPMKKSDPTEYTYQWAQKAIKMAKDLGYNVRVLEKDNVTYNNVSEAIKKYNPRILATFSHGCPSSIQGQNECAIVRKYNVDELICLAESPHIEDRQRMIKLLDPLGELSCPGICRLDKDPCSPLCTSDTNINLLKGSIVFAVACHSASQLGRCAINYGVQTYIGYSDLLMFPVDTLESQDMFGDIQLTFLKELLMGNTVQEAEIVMSELEDSYIRRFKKVKYVALPMLWDKIHRRTLGDKNAMIYE
jgi:hypothetical protein